MDVVIALVFFSLMLVAAALAFFVSRLKEGDFEHGDRLSLLPLAQDDGTQDDEMHDGLTPDRDATTEEDDPAHGSN